MDFHFHLDRMEISLEGRGPGLIHKHCERPTRKEVQLTGGVINYCDPCRFKDIYFPADRNWMVAVGIHPKYAGGVGDPKLDELARLICNPRVCGFGEVGLDYTSNSKFWDSQLFLLKACLRIGVAGKVLVLHIRGQQDAPDADVPSKLVRQAVAAATTRHQRINIHCCSLGVKEVDAWRRQFPHTYFGYTARTRHLKPGQMKALKSVPTVL